MNPDSALLALIARLVTEGIAYQQRIAQLEQRIKELEKAKDDA